VHRILKSDDDDDEDEPSSWLGQRLQETLSTVKSVVSTVPIATSVATERGWDDDEPETERPVLTPAPAPSDSEEDDERKPILRLEVATRNNSRSSTAVFRPGDEARDAARLEVAALAFDRCAEVDEAKSEGRYRAKRLAKQKATLRDFLRALLSHPAFFEKDDAADDDPQPPSSSPEKTVFHQYESVFFDDDDDDRQDRQDDDDTQDDDDDDDSSTKQKKAASGLDFAQTLRWLQRNGAPRPSTTCSPKKTPGAYPVWKLPRAGLFSRRAFAEDELDDVFHGAQQKKKKDQALTGVWCDVAGTKAEEGFVSVTEIESGMTFEFDLRIVDLTFDLLRRAAAFCPFGLGEVPHSRARSGVVIVDANEGRGKRADARHPGGRVVFAREADLLAFWRWASDARTGGAVTGAQPPKSRPSEGGQSTPKGSEVLAAQDRRTRDTTLVEPLVDALFGGNKKNDDAPFMDSLGIVDALATAVIRPPRWRAPTKALGPRMFLAPSFSKGIQQQQPWCRVDFVVRGRGDTVDLQCALWAPAADLAEEGEEKSPSNDQSRSDQRDSGEKKTKNLLLKAATTIPKKKTTTATTAALGSLKSPLSKRKRRTCVLYVHGNSSCRAEAVGSIRGCAALGTALCALDCAGSGASTGDFVTLGLRESRDVTAVAIALRRRFGFDKVALWGRSMGAVAALLSAAERDLDVHCAVADSPFESLSTLCVDLVDRSARAAFGVLDPASAASLKGATCGEAVDDRPLIEGGLDDRPADSEEDDDDDDDLNTLKEKKPDAFASTTTNWWTGGDVFSILRSSSSSSSSGPGSSGLVLENGERRDYYDDDDDDVAKKKRRRRPSTTTTGAPPRGARRPGRPAAEAHRRRRRPATKGPPPLEAAAKAQPLAANAADEKGPPYAAAAAAGAAAFFFFIEYNAAALQLRREAPS